MIDFELIVPDGWAHIPTTPESARLRSRTIDALITSRLPESLPRDKAVPFRKMLRGELVKATDDAARNGARAIVLPLTEYHDGWRVPGSLLITVVEESDDAPDPLTLIGALIGDAGPGNGTRLEIGGGPAARITEVLASDPIGRKAPSLKVSYYIAHPEVTGVWALLTYTVLTDGDLESEVLTAICLLFDAVVATLRWQDRIDVPTEDELIDILNASPTT
ncbi:hypothetical protein FB565_008070 [Actinoplanes lutulentus]|uniref:Uncharacterized protein n=1 Tax=Actinoplanes lutulentus TaxID=1287878 RepID=A0A327Z4S2_9ACTN|nr:hypothetical protein [Actinoplanes lutulentus]MBB2948287.1 hypothetical protein [Actinoplanes lutulentus]RAK31216.1 hypothetical protein B0I29_11522 [Actinoplanes lutulentus]